MKYAYIAYFGKSEVIVNEQPKPEKYYSINNEKKLFENHSYERELLTWQSSCRVIPIAQGYENLIMDYIHQIAGNPDETISVNRALESGIILPSELVRFENVCCQTGITCGYPCNGEDNCNKGETAFFVEKEQETNEAENELWDELIWYFDGITFTNLEAVKSKFTITRKHPTK